MKYFAIKPEQNNCNTKYLHESNVGCEQVAAVEIIERNDFEICDETVTTWDYDAFPPIALDSYKEDVIAGRTRISLTMLATYNAAPLARFRRATDEEINQSTDECSDDARKLLADGREIWIAEDEDGQYFAVRS